MSRDVIITYETLYEILRREKLRPELQPLDKSFFQDIVKYLSEKQSILQSQMGKASIFSSSETKKNQKQIENLKRMVKELYERRENKILQIAVFSSRTDDKVDFHEMLEEERQFFKNLVFTLNIFRKNVLFNILALKNPELSQEGEPKELKTENKPHNKLIRFLHATPKFVDDNLKVHGPFEEEDLASLPLKVANILIKNDRAEVIQVK